MTREEMISHLPKESATDLSNSYTILGVGVFLIIIVIVLLSLEKLSETVATAMAGVMFLLTLAVAIMVGIYDIGKNSSDYYELKSAWTKEYLVPYKDQLPVQRYEVVGYSIDDHGWVNALAKVKGEVVPIPGIDQVEESSEGKSYITAKHFESFDDYAIGSYYFEAKIFLKKGD